MRQSFDIDKAIKYKYTRHLTEYLLDNPSFFENCADLREEVINSYFNRSTISGLLWQMDLERLLVLVQAKIVDLEDFESRVPRNNFRLLVLMEDVRPGWTSVEEIIRVACTTEESFRDLFVFTRKESTRGTHPFGRSMARVMERLPELKEKTQDMGQIRSVLVL